MKKNEYVTPGMEVVEVSTQNLIMSSTEAGGEIGGLSRGGVFDDEDL